MWERPQNKKAIALASISRLFERAASLSDFCTRGRYVFFGSDRIPGCLADVNVQETKPAQTRGMKAKGVYINNTLIGEAATWAAAYMLVSQKDISFVGTPEAAEGPTAFFLQGMLTPSDPSKSKFDAQPLAPRPIDVSEATKAIAQGLIISGRARSPQFDGGMLRLECLSGGFYWISFEGRRVLRGKLLLEADELQRRFIDDMERAGRT